MNKKNLLIVLVIVVLAALGFAGYQRVAANRAAAESPATETAVVQRGDLTVTLDATGSLLAPSEIRLAFASSGEVAQVLVAEGQAVAAGDLLARLDDAAFRLQMEQAELNLQSLTSQYTIAEAEKELADAYDALHDAEYTNRVQQEGNRGSASDIDGLKAELILADDKVERKQEVFDNVADKSEDNYRRAVAQAELSAAIDARDAVARQLNWYLGAPTDLDQTILDADVTIARARVAAAQALLAELKGDPLPPDTELYIDPTITQLRQARISLESAQLALADTRILAPAAGTITSLDVQAGEFIAPGQPVIVLSEVDDLQAEVNLDETDVARVSVGMPVNITVAAFPGAELTGQVIEIDPTANVQSGVVLYSVTVRLDPTNSSTSSGQVLPLRSGMTVNVTIPIEKRADTLLVPFRAVETEGGQAYVTRVTASGSERVAVTLGLITDTQVEILSGIEERDVVTVYANPVQDTQLMNNPMFGGGQ